MNDLRPGDRRVFITDGKGGHQRIVPVGDLFFGSLAAYFAAKRRPATVSTRCSYCSRDRTGAGLSAAGVDEVLSGARRRTGLAHATCHELRHTCFTRLRESGIALEAIQAQAGHASIESTRIYCILPRTGWLMSTAKR